MTDRDRGTFATVILGLGEIYGESVSETRMEIYFVALADLELADVRAAAAMHVRYSKFFPRPAELREAIDGSAEDRAELAWAAVQGIVRHYGYYDVPPAVAWPDAAGRAAAMSMYGGWRSLCAKLPGEGPELLGAAKLFKAAYIAYAAHARRGLELPAGREAEQAQARGALSSLKRALLDRRLSDHGLLATAARASEVIE